MPEPTRDDADVAVLGVPWDLGTTSRTGTRMGPRALREASTLYAFRDGTEALWDGEAGVRLMGGVRWADAGDVTLGPMWLTDRYHQAVVDRLRPILQAGVFPVTLGGDHSITYPLLKAVYETRGERPFDLVQFDTHMDYWDEEGGERYTHASPIIRSHEAGWLSGLTQYGIRSLHTAGDNIGLARRRGAHIFWAEQAKDMRPAELVEHLKPGADVYITFDIDALDPAIAPGTGTPEPGGFSYYEAKAILLAVCARCNVIGMDLVEVAPQYDGPGQITALHGARLDPRHRGRRVPPPGRAGALAGRYAPAHRVNVDPFPRPSPLQTAGLVHARLRGRPRFPRPRLPPGSTRRVVHCRLIRALAVRASRPRAAAGGGCGRLRAPPVLAALTERDLARQTTRTASRRTASASSRP